MKARAVWVASVTVALLAITGTALAKGASEARLEGPGLAGPVAIGGDGEPGSGELLAQLAEQTGLFPAMFPRTPNPMSPSAPPGALGARYVVTYVVPSESGQDEIRQDVYPFADGGPVTYTQSGQQFFDGVVLGGWFRSPVTLVDTLIALGVPASGPSVAPTAAADAPRPAGPNLPVVTDSSSFGFVVLVLASLLILSATVALLRGRTARTVRTR